MSFIPPNDVVKVFKKNNETYFYLSQRIDFSLNETTIEEGWKPQLFLIIQALKKNSKVKIEIGVHNDLRSREDLSQSRADVLKSFLTNYGVKDDNIITKGYGSNAPLINCLDKQIKCTEYNQKSNRRVELKILNPAVLDNYIVVNSNIATQPIFAKRIVKDTKLDSSDPVIDVSETVVDTDKNQSAEDVDALKEKIKALEAKLKSSESKED